MFPRLNYESIASAYRQIREKYFLKRYRIIVAVVFLICIIIGLLGRVLGLFLVLIGKQFI